MRTTILFLFFLVSLGTLHAQKLQVESMEVAANDISASSMPRADRNGKPCGLVKVQLAVMGASFEGNIIGDVDYKTGEYWVYMNEGAYLLHIKHPSFLPLEINFRDYDIRVEGKTTYKLVVSLPSSPMEIDDGMRYLRLIVNPRTAQVSIDGKPKTVNQTDGSVSVLLASGNHQWEVAAEGYATRKGTVTLREKSETVEVNLESVLATVNISCPTQGAMIYVDNQLRGSSPWSGSLVPGIHQFEARRESHRSQRLTEKLEEKESRRVEIPALQPITGALNVDYSPINTEVWIDGQKKGIAPDVFRGLLVGNHQVELRKEGYRTASQIVTVLENQTAQLKGQLTSNNSQLTATSQSNTTNNTSATAISTTTGNTSNNSANMITIKGTVVDKDGPIIGASVNVGGSNTRGTGTITNIDGNFELKVERNSHITVRYIGFKPYDFAATDNISNYTIKLKSSTGKPAFAITAGMNLSKWTGNLFDFKPGYQVGLEMYKGIGSGFGMNLGLSYSAKGFKVKGTDDKYSANYIHVPLQLTYGKYMGGIIWRVHAGPYGAFGVGGDVFDDPVKAKKFDYGMQFGLGICVPQYAFRHFFFKASYELGMNKLIDDSKNRNISFTLGYYL